MKVKEIVLIALLSALEFVIFSSFSYVLYLELITFVIVVIALNFSLRVSILSSLVFALINILFVQGIQFWSAGYLVIYPTYSLIVGLNKKYLTSSLVVSVICGFLSFLTGQLLQIPFMLLSSHITFLYIILGLKTSLIQGIISGISCFILFKHVVRVLNSYARRI
ncbi:MAG: cytochrome B [Erysipelotrichaceae bacterium]